MLPITVTQHFFRDATDMPTVHTSYSRMPNNIKFIFTIDESEVDKKLINLQVPATEEEEDDNNYLYLDEAEEDPIPIVVNKEEAADDKSLNKDDNNHLYLDEAEEDPIRIVVNKKEAADEDDNHFEADNVSKDDIITLSKDLFVVSPPEPSVQSFLLSPEQISGLREYAVGLGKM